MMLFFSFSFLAPVANCDDKMPVFSDYDYLPISNTEVANNLEPITSSGTFPNLEENPQDFILEIKKIKIPGHPSAFNPAITRWNGELLLSFRTYDQRGRTDGIGIVWLDEHFNVASKTYLLEIRNESPSASHIKQDPYLLSVGDKLYIIYSNMMDGTMIRRVFLAELHFDGNAFYIENPECLSHFPGENERRWEKNWVPFDYQGNLLLSYSIFPHMVLQPLLGMSSCIPLASTKSAIEWNWGHLRGGSPALSLGDEYLAFFHSSKNMQTAQSKGKNITHYFMGAYTFSSKPPFAITKISPNPIIGKDFYNGVAHKTWKPLHVVFPRGFVMDDQYIWVSYGRQDFEMWVVKLDKKGLLNSLVPVSSSE